MKVLFSMIMTIISIGIYSQTPNWNWVKKGNGSNQDFGRGVTTDASGNVYTTGSFYSSSIALGAFTLTNKNNTGSTPDVFIAKYDIAGSALWARSAKGKLFDEGQAIATDINGNVFVTGYFYSDTLIVGTSTVINTGADDIFIVKYDSNGNFQWVRTASGTLNDRGLGIKIDQIGDIIITGYFESPTLNFNGTTLTNSGGSDIFVVKYNQSGNIIWAKSNGGNFNDTSYGIAIDNFNNIYIAGDFKSNTITFGTNTFTNTNAGNPDIIVVKYDALGNVVWAKQTGGSSEEYAYGICSDTNNNIVVSGYFQSTSINFGTGALIKHGTYNSYVVKYNSNGIPLWSKNTTSTYTNKSYAVTTDGADNVIITGSYYSGNMFFGTYTLSNVGDNDIYVAKYDPTGNFLWAKGSGGLAADFGYGISAHSNGNLHVIGIFNSTSISFDTFTLNTSGSADVFIGKIGNNIIGINEIMNEAEMIKIFPNPTSDYIIIENIKHFTSLDLFDCSGNFVQNLSFLNSNTKINLKNLKKGIYYLSVLDRGIRYKNIKLILTE